jgi:subtilisin family serine protease
MYETHPKWINEECEIACASKVDYKYGFALSQIEQLNGVPLHKNGYTGEGVLIAVLDGGFNNVDKTGGFSHLYESGRVLFEDNVVEPERSIYDVEISNHGTSVLSCMGGLISDIYAGTAAKASYALIRTEDTPTEYLIEEYFWMIGAEKSDSIGADIINSSLGYQNFDDTSMNHSHSDMDGKTAISSIAAKMAVERGIFVSVSAGNSNGTEYPFVGSPADTPEALTLGAVDINGEIASFSSIGPNGAGYPKPDVVACGSYAAIITTDNQIGYASGTSFSSPITCGLVACVIQAAPTKQPAEIIDAIQKSADRYPTHDIQYGYGIPDFAKALQLLGVEISVNDYNNESKLLYYPNPVNDKLYLGNHERLIASIEIYDIAGRKIKSISANAYHLFIDVKEMSIGLKFVKVVYDNHESEVIKVVIGE